MKHKITQVVYNQGDDTQKFTAGSIFEKYMPIVSLGIQAIGGVKMPKFYVNNNESPIYIGYTGIYELDLIGVSQISSLKICPEDDTKKILVDIVYESED